MAGNSVSDTLVSFTLSDEDERLVLRDYLADELKAEYLKESAYILHGKSPEDSHRRIKGFLRRKSIELVDPDSVNFGWYGRSEFKL